MLMMLTKNLPGVVHMSNCEFLLFLEWPFGVVFS